MKKTVTINLGGRAFLITEEAYNSLEDYLSSLATTFNGHESSEEIIADIESRISELCDRRLAQSHGEIIELALVNEMINRMGKPGAMIDEESETYAPHSSQENEQEEPATGSNGEKIFEKMQLNKKYYLNSDDRMAGGVISGLATYLKIDVTILRIIALFAIIATGLVGIITYFIVWYIAPTAGNTSEKLRMQGIEPTPEKIAEKIVNEPEGGCKSPTPTTEKEKSNITRLVVVAIIASLAYIAFGFSYFTIDTGNNILGARIDNDVKNGAIILFCILLAGFFVQKSNLPRVIKNTLLVLIVAFALIAIFAMMMNTF